MKEDYITPKELAAELKVTLKTIYRWLSSGAIPGARIGPHGNWRIPKQRVLTHGSK